MDVFAIKKSKAKKLEIDEFEKVTKKRMPFYQHNEKNKLLLYAICPECGNPIQIVNLYGPEMIQNKTRIVKKYAKHTRSRIRGFLYWDKNEKENCSLYNPSPLGNREIRNNDTYSQELRELIEKNKRDIFKDIRKIVSINLSGIILEHLFEVFMNSKAYGFRAVNKYNIPYAMMYYQQSISLYGQYFLKSEFGEMISNEINRNSRFFEVTIASEIVKKVVGYRTINMIFTHFRQKDTNQSVRLEIYESSDGAPPYTICKEEINIKPYIYD